MKAFRGTLLTAILAVVIAAIVGVLRPDLFSKAPEAEPRLFEFEKHELVRVRFNVLR